MMPSDTEGKTPEIRMIAQGFNENRRVIEDWRSSAQKY
jgi:hypothetical protein